jgi:arabinose-5-phosphate isomerase
MSSPARSAAPAAGSAKALASARRTIGIEARGLAALELALAEALAAPFAEAIAAILSVSGRVIVTGMGKSGHVGRKIAATFASTGTPAYFVHPAEASHGDLGMVLKEDLILALSWSGEAKELADIIAHARRFGVPLIAITARADSALGRQATIRLVLPAAEEACPNGLAPTTSTLMQMAIGDALAVALLEARGFSGEDFRVFHPGGRLGAQLTTVAHVMHTGDALPVVAPDTPVGAALPVMSAKGFGVVLVVAGGRLQGLFTDGDLRRQLIAGGGAALTDQPVAAVMTRSPATIGMSALAVDAMTRLQQRKLGLLPVIDEAGALVGLLHIQDLLRIGVA